MRNKKVLELIQIIAILLIFALICFTSSIVRSDFIEDCIKSGYSETYCRSQE